MKTKPMLMIILGSLISVAAIADTTVQMATDDDLSAFDANLAKARKKQVNTSQAAAIGADVSKKAQELHKAVPPGYSNFGQSVSAQRRNQGNQGGNSQGNNAGGNGQGHGQGNIKPPNPNKKVK